MSTKAEEKQVLTGGHDLVYAMDPTGRLVKPTDPFSENVFSIRKIKCIELQRKQLG